MPPNVARSWAISGTSRRLAARSASAVVRMNSRSSGTNTDVAPIVVIASPAPSRPQPCRTNRNWPHWLHRQARSARKSGGEAGAGGPRRQCSVSSRNWKSTAVTKAWNGSK